MVALALEIKVEHEKSEGDAAKYLAGFMPTDDLLDVVDATLYQGGPWPETPEFDYTGDVWRRNRAILLKELDLLLSAASSFVQVNETQDGLIRRVDATATDAFVSATTAAAQQPSAGSAASQIRDAWKELYQVNRPPRLPTAMPSRLWSQPRTQSSNQITPRRRWER